MTSYEDFRIFWEVWERNTKRRVSEAEAANCDAAAAIFMAIAVGSINAGTPQHWLLLEARYLDGIRA